LSAPPVAGVSVYSQVARPNTQSGTAASLVFEDGESAGQKVPLRVRNFLIGRERDCHFRPKSASVSHHHCVLKTDAFAVRIRDLGSRNGTYVNGHRIHQEVALHHSDSVWIGDVRFKVDIPNDLYAGIHSAEAQLSLDEFRIY
jgi:pSer/pThr/pTyr-binding forkhead associated (FHA) protein